MGALLARFHSRRQLLAEGGSDEQMFGAEQQVPYGARSDQESELRQPGLEVNPGRGSLQVMTNAEDPHHRDRAAADARHRAAIPATTATEAARPMVPGGLDGERQLLRTGLRQGAGRDS